MYKFICNMVNLDNFRRYRQFLFNKQYFASQNSFISKRISYVQIRRLCHNVCLHYTLQI